MLAAVAGGGIASLAGCSVLGDVSGTYLPCDDDSPEPNEELPRAGDWPIPRGDPSNTGVNPDGRGPASISPSVEPRKLLERHHDPLNTPIVVDGVAFVLGRSSLYALDVESTEMRWEIQLDQPTRQTVFASGRLILSTESGYIVALDPDTGCSYWAFDAGEPLSAMNVSDEHVFFATSDSSEVGALSLATGSKEWRVAVDVEYVGGLGFRQKRLVVSGDPTVVALDSATGAEQWARRVPNGFDSSPPVIVDDSVYALSNDFQLFAHDLFTGDVRWRTDPAIEISRIPAATADAVYAAGRDGIVTALSPSDGVTEHWRIDGEWWSPDGTPILAGSTMYLPLHNNLLSIDAATGDQFGRLWFAGSSVCGTTEGLFFTAGDHGSALYHYPV